MSLTSVQKLVSLLLLCGAALLAFYISLQSTRPDLRSRYEHKVESTTRSRSDLNVSLIARDNVTSRIQIFIEAIETFRSQLLASTRVMNETHGNIPVKHFIKVIDDSYLVQLRAFEHIVTKTLPWQQSSAKDNTLGNLLVHKYFPWIAGKKLCKLIEKKSIFPNIYVRMFRQLKCSTDYHQAMTSTSLNYGHMKTCHARRYPNSYYATPPDNILYMHILKSDTLVTAMGDVINSGVKIAADYCARRADFSHTVSPSEYAKLPIYDEVFTIKHEPGEAVYHGFIEELPRIAPFVDFLKSHPNIKIHATANVRIQQMLKVIGFDKSRLVHGAMRARVVYVPRHAFCMLARVTEVQVLSSLYRNYIHNNLPKRPRNRIVLIRRSGKRRFRHPNQIEAVVKKAAMDYNLMFSVFRDNPLPPLNETMLMFQSAVMVVAAHGAGLSNIVFSEPETFVIELVPYSGITPLCFLHLAHVLGHHWHGVLSSTIGFGVVDMHPEELNSIIRQYLTVKIPK